MNYRLRQTNRGFTLIELLIVIVIIGILVTMGTFAFISSQKKARDSKRKEDLTQIAKALEMYNSDRGVYPNSTNNTIYGCGVTFTSICNWGTTFGNGSTITYMAKLPKDPTAVWYYAYTSLSDGFRLYARLENLEDASIPTTGSKEYPVLCGTGIYCNYVFTSPNLTDPALR
jgi:type II secretion system protein G